MYSLGGGFRVQIRYRVEIHVHRPILQGQLDENSNAPRPPVFRVKGLLSVYVNTVYGKEAIKEIVYGKEGIEGTLYQKERIEGTVYGMEEIVYGKDGRDCLWEGWKVLFMRVDF